jgi:hypothetical protein
MKTSPPVRAFMTRALTHRENLDGDMSGEYGRPSGIGWNRRPGFPIIQSGFSSFPDK